MRRLKTYRLRRPGYWLIVSAAAVLIFLAAGGANFGLFVGRNREARRHASPADPPVTLTLRQGTTRAVGVTYPPGVETDAVQPEDLQIVGPDGPIALDGDFIDYGDVRGERLVELGAFVAPTDGTYVIRIRPAREATGLRIWTPVDTDTVTFEILFGAAIAAVIAATAAVVLALRRRSAAKATRS